MIKRLSKFKLPASLKIILLLGLFLRIYKFSEFFVFGHEQDLQAWIVKDILVDQHPRLIGQETSIPGLFIGPLYYYMIVPFFAIFGMDPRASIIPITLISLATIVSVYFVLAKLYGKKVALIGAFIYSVSPAIIFLDRWVVPTQPTLLWIIWFYYVVMKFVRGEFEVAPVLIILVGLIWHIHIAFVPLLLLVPVAIYLSKSDPRNSLAKINKKQLRLSLFVAFILLTPLIAFELRHNFQQVRGVLDINQSREGQARELREGYYKVEVIGEYMNKVLWSPIFYQIDSKKPSLAKIPLALFIFLGLVIWLFKKKKLKAGELVLLLAWLGIVFAGQMVNKRIISDYYFNNLIIISIAVFSLFAYHLSLNKKTRGWILFGGFVFLIFGFGKVLTRKVIVREFGDREAVVEFITQDVKDRGYPCEAINYIGDIPVRYGYRYLFWWKGGRQITPGNDVPVYSIVQPYTISEDEVEFRSGEIGLILPAGPRVPNESVCSNPERQLLPLNGFVN